MSVQDAKARMVKVIAAHQRGLITETELQFHAIALIGISNELSLFDLLPASLQSELLTQCSAMSDQDIQGVFTIVGGTGIIEDVVAYRKEREAEDEACRNAYRMIRRKARKDPTC